MRSGSLGNATGASVSLTGKLVPMNGTSLPLVRTSDSVTAPTYRSIGTLGKTTGTLVPMGGTDDRDSVPRVPIILPLVPLIGASDPVVGNFVTLF